MDNANELTTFHTFVHFGSLLITFRVQFDHFSLFLQWRAAVASAYVPPLLRMVTYHFNKPTGTVNSSALMGEYVLIFANVALFGLRSATSSAAAPGVLFAVARLSLPSVWQSAAQQRAVSCMRRIYMCPERMLH